MYAELRAGAEPLRRGQRLEDGQPEHDPGGEEADVLERVDARSCSTARLVESGQVPEHEVRGPDREARRAGSRGRAGA